MYIDSYIGEDTAVKVYFDYTPPEPEVLYPNDKAQPGYPAEIDITSVTIAGDDNILEDLTETVTMRFEQEAWDSIAQGDGENELI